MEQKFPYPKLILHDRYAQPTDIRMQGQAHSHQTQYPSYPVVRARHHEQMQKPSYSVINKRYPDLPSRHVTKGSRRLLFVVLAFLLTIAIAMSGIHYVLTSSSAVRGKPISFINVQMRTQPSSKPGALKEVAQVRIDQFAADIDKIKLLGGDVTAYQQTLVQDQAKLAGATAQKDYVSLLVQVANDIAVLQGDLAGGNVNTLLSNFQQEAQQWADAHKYHDPYDGKDYYLNSSYLNMDGHNGVFYGEGAYMRQEIDAGNPQAAQDIKDDYFLLSMLEANYQDATPYNQPHQVDQSILNYFHFQHTRVLIVSLTEQALRIYNNGTLEQTFQVTTGRVYRPTPVGHFQLTQHFQNYTLTSYDAPDSPDYYPPVVTQNAIQFMDNGYLIHSSQWRQDYGPLTQFPHRDAGGDPQASTGTHGCINVAPDILSKLAPTITYQTPLIIF